MTTLKTFTAWTRKANTNDQFCTQYIKAKNINDIDLTRKIKEAGFLLDLRLYDHIIVAGNSYYSFTDNGYI